MMVRLRQGCHMGNPPLRIIQISDTHIYADPQRSLLGVPTQKSFQAIIDLLQKEEGQIDFILHSGDLSQDGTDASYIRLAEMLKVLSVPVYCVAGNHDDTKIMASLYPRETISNHKHIVLKNWHIILLNSQKPGAIEGHLDISQLNYLQHCLQAYPEHQAIVVFHHQPIPVGSRWLDNLGLNNAKKFWQVISHYPKVNTVLFGHVHQEFEQVFKGVKCYSVPATCFQFKRKKDDFGLENSPQGYRWVNLYDDGRIETGVKRLERYFGEFDAHATGY